jgi:hypothetical protein
MEATGDRAVPWWYGVSSPAYAEENLPSQYAHLAVVMHVQAQAHIWKP